MRKFGTNETRRAEKSNGRAPVEEGANNEETERVHPRSIDGRSDTVTSILDPTSPFTRALLSRALSRTGAAKERDCILSRSLEYAGSTPCYLPDRRLDFTFM